MTQQGSERSSNNTTPFFSPPKARLKQSHGPQGAGEYMEKDCNSREDTRELVEVLEEFPTQRQPIINTTLNYMLILLRSSLHTDMVSFK